MAKLSDEEQAQLDALQKKLEAPDDDGGPRHSQRTDVRVQIDLNDETQVKRAVRAGLLPASYLEDDDDEPPADDEPPPDDEPARRMGRRYS